MVDISAFDNFSDNFPKKGTKWRKKGTNGIKQISYLPKKGNIVLQNEGRGG